MGLRFAVDWDGTAVEDSWPKMGDWNPGAIENIRKLTHLGEVTIHTCRTAPMEFGTLDVPRDPALVRMEKDGIRAMLDAEGLHEVTLWDHPFKPPALVYIDNRALNYNGRKGAWDAIYTRLAVQLGKSGE